MKAASKKNELISLRSSVKDINVENIALSNGFKWLLVRERDNLVPTNLASPHQRMVWGIGIDDMDSGNSIPYSQVEVNKIEKDELSQILTPRSAA